MTNPIPIDVLPPKFDSVVDLTGTRKTEVDMEAATEVDKVATVSDLKSASKGNTIISQVSNENKLIWKSSTNGLSNGTLHNETVTKKY